MLFPVNCSEVSFFHQTLYSEVFYCLGKHSPEHPCFWDTPAHPPVVAACRRCPWMSCTRRVCRQWMHVLGMFGGQGSHTPKGLVFAALIPRTAASVLCVTLTRAARALLGKHSRWNSPIMFLISIFLVNVLQLLLNHVCSQ